MVNLDSIWNGLTFITAEMWSYSMLLSPKRGNWNSIISSGRDQVFLEPVHGTLEAQAACLLLSGRAIAL